jgi:hypothetical protein
MAFSTVCLGVVLLRYQSPAVRTGVRLKFLGPHHHHASMTWPHVCEVFLHIGNFVPLQENVLQLIAVCVRFAFFQERPNMVAYLVVAFLFLAVCLAVALREAMPLWLLIVLGLCTCVPVVWLRWMPHAAITLLYVHRCEVVCCACVTVSACVL